MTFALAVLLLLALVLAAVAVRGAAHDGPGRAAPPASHRPDPDFAPASLLR